VIAANGGVEVAAQLGLRVDLAVGDFDSAAAPAGVELDQHPAEKDASDLELALDTALRQGAQHLVVVGGAAGRLDHLLGTLLLLARDAYANVTVDAQLGEAAAHIVRAERIVRGEPGETISLFALGGPARGIATDGLRYALSDETLEPGSTRGLSNVFVAPEVRIGVREGVLIAITPRGSAWAAAPP
jgi:thiamine pyrophosphokinase